MTLLLTPRSDWLDDRRFIYSVSVENVGRADFLEADPVWFFDNTYPSEDMRRLLHGYAEAASHGRNLVAAIIGGYGTGKSHLLSLVYHAATNLREGPAWLDRWAARFPLLGDLALPNLDVQPLVFSTKSQGGRHRFLWEALFSEAVAGAAGLRALEVIRSQTEPGRSPDKETIQEALDAFGQGKYLILLLDELDAWVGELEAAKTPNIYFVEKLAEIFSQGMVRGVLLLSLRGIDRLLLEAVQRSGAELFRPGQAIDRTTIIRFRLFGEPDDEKRQQIAELAGRYVEVYRRALDRFNQDETLRELQRDNGDDLRTYAERIMEGYPFHPAMLWALLRKYDALYEDSKQGLRGPMFILRSLLQNIDLAEESRDLILAGDLDYKTVARYLYEEQVQTRCQDDHRRFAIFRHEERPKQYHQLLNIAFLYSLPENTHPVGATRSHIVYGLVRPTSQLHDVCNDVSLFLRLSLYVSVTDGQMRLNLDRKVDVEVDDRAREIEESVALRRLAVLIKQMAGVSETGHEAVLLEDPDVPAVLSGKAFRVVYSLQRESEPTLSKRLYTWLGRVDAQYRNLTVFVIPEMGCDLAGNRDFVWLVQQLKAAEEVAFEYQKHAETASGDAKRDYLQRADTARTIFQRAQAKIRQVLTEDTRWYLATFHEYDQAAQGYTIYPEPLNLDKGYFPQRHIIKNRLSDKAREGNYAPLRPKIKVALAQFVHTPQVSGLTIEDQFHASLGMPVLPDEGLILAAALVEMGADKEIYYKAGGKVYYGNRPAAAIALSAITETSLQPILDQPAVHIPIPTVQPTTSVATEVHGVAEPTGTTPSQLPGAVSVTQTAPAPHQVASLTDRPAKVIFDLEERANTGPLSIQRAILAVRLDGPQPLAQLAPSGLPQVTVPGAALRIELDLSGLPWDQISTILNSLSSITELRSPRLAPGDKGKTLTVEFLA